MPAPASRGGGAGVFPHDTVRGVSSLQHLCSLLPGTASGISLYKIEDCHGLQNDCVGFLDVLLCD